MTCFLYEAEDRTRSGKDSPFGRPGGPADWLQSPRPHPAGRSWRGRAGAARHTAPLRAVSASCPRRPAGPCPRLTSADVVCVSPAASGPFTPDAWPLYLLVSCQACGWWSYERRLCFSRAAAWTHLREGGGGDTGEVGEEERKDERGKSEMKNVLKLCGEETGRSSCPWGIKIDPEEVPSKCNSIWITQAVSVSRLLQF